MGKLNMSQHTLELIITKMEERVNMLEARIKNMERENSQIKKTLQNVYRIDDVDSCRKIVRLLKANL